MRGHESIRQAVMCAPPGDKPKTVGLPEAWRLAIGRSRQAVNTFISSGDS